MTNIPKRYKDANFKNVPKDIKKVFSELRETRKGIYLHGGVGTGKTHMAYALYDEWERLRKEEQKQKQDKIRELVDGGMSQYRAEEEHGIRPKPFANFWNMTSMLYELRKEFRKTPEDLLSDRLIMNKDLLFIDDLGAEKVTEWVEEIIYLIINTRYESDIPIIVTSNYKLSEIADRVGDRVASRIKEMCHIISVDGEDRRLKSK